MQLHTLELRCPYCHAAQPTADAGRHTCEFCLRGFTAVEAAQAKHRSGLEAADWLRSRVGGEGEAEVVDQASRGFIFRQRILPELERDATRVCEGLGPWLQAPLILPELARGSTTGEHPLLRHRGRLEALAHQRARLSQEQIARFAVGESERAELAAMQTQLDQMVHLINVVEAAERGGSEGWAAVHTNLEALAREPAGSAELGDLLTERWRLLGALAQHYAEVAGDRHPPDQIEVIDGIVDGLRSLSAKLRERSPSGELRACALGVEREAAGASSLVSWLRCRSGLPRARAHSLSHLREALTPLLPDGRDPDHHVSLVNSWVEIAAAVRQETGFFALTDFSWVEAWAASQRRAKRFGLFGVDESILRIDTFFVPVWIAELTYSQHQGSFLGGGVEQQGLALVEACACSVDSFSILDPGHSEVYAALAQPTRLDSQEIALPATVAAEAQAVIDHALRLRSDLRNPRFELRGLALIPAATATLGSSQGQRRSATAALGGRLPASTYARDRVELGRWFFGQFG